MSTIAYITNEFPSAVEPYVVDEVRALRQRGVKVITASGHWVEPSSLSPGYRTLAEKTTYLRPLSFMLVVRALWLLIRHFNCIRDVVKRVLRGKETMRRRVHAVAHTVLGAAFAVMVKDRGVKHIHVHHAYFSSWVAMVAARLLKIGFSMTVHGSDILLRADYLDIKLENCDFCVTISEYNRRHILTQFPNIPARKLVLQRVGVDCGGAVVSRAYHRRNGHLEMLAVGRLHPVKDFDFLLQACAQLKRERIPFRCRIAGEGPERERLQHAIHDIALDGNIELLGHVAPEKLGDYYKGTDLVVLTSRSEGIPLVLMEAMARGKVVLAPKITGIPELVQDGENGFLFRAGSLEDFVLHIQLINETWPKLSNIRRRARATISRSFDRQKNVKSFCDFLLERIPAHARGENHESAVLQ